MALARCHGIAALAIVRCPSAFAAGRYFRGSNDQEFLRQDVGRGRPRIMMPGWTASGVTLAHLVEHVFPSRRRQFHRYGLIHRLAGLTGNEMVAPACLWPG